MVWARSRITAKRSRRSGPSAFIGKPPGFPRVNVLARVASDAVACHPRCGLFTLGRTGGASLRMQLVLRDGKLIPKVFMVVAYADLRGYNWYGNFVHPVMGCWDLFEGGEFAGLFSFSRAQYARDEKYNPAARLFCPDVSEASGLFLMRWDEGLVWTYRSYAWAMNGSLTMGSDPQWRVTCLRSGPGPRTLRCSIAG